MSYIPSCYTWRFYTPSTRQDVATEAYSVEEFKDEGDNSFGSGLYGELKGDLK